MARVDSAFIDEVRQSDHFDASACMHCGQCTAICPMGLELLPRQLFLYAVAGLKVKVVENQETIFSCLLCRLCEQNCPRGVNIAEDVRYLRNYINRKVYKIARN